MSQAIYSINEGATLRCSLGTAASQLKVPQNRGATVQGKNQATIADHVGNVNIMPFSMCTRVSPPVPFKILLQQAGIPLTPPIHQREQPAGTVCLR